MAPTSRSKFYLVAQQDGSYEGTIRLENGKDYSGKIYANTSDSGLWYRGNLTAIDQETHARDGALMREFMQAGEEAGKGTKPLELRLNPWKGGRAELIGTLVTSDGRWTIFANSGKYGGRLVLRGSIRQKQDKPAGEDPEPALPPKESPRSTRGEMPEA